ncbi:SdrD B-like domain-containing protein [Runella sp. SP2]|uniref:SdrD B-like domain-containing protein n=1 Tax=Runella sp. SP2 TaxID=2268026 RepID=UPI000F073A71|nr:SdrD B-like domain-containing protein [Runella sp. SP2]AYQ33346.1 DUF11 domain-containing protein [Runella sp. SP2]
MKIAFTSSRFVVPLLFTLGLTLSCLQGYAQVRGTVFRDFNGNGTRDTNEPLIPGVVVNVYNTSSGSGVLCGTTTTSGNTAPNYNVAGCGTGDVRVEFVLPTSGQCAIDSLDFSALGGATYGSSVQFAKGNSTNVNFGLYYPNDFNLGAANSMVYVPCYVHGDPVASGGASGASEWFVGFPYNNTGSTTPPSKKLNGYMIGATWGVAYSRKAKKIFTSALIKRHVGLGQLGTGGIYIIDEATFVADSLYDLDKNGFRTRAAATAPAYGSSTSYALATATAGSPAVANTGVSVSFLGSTDPVSGLPEGLGVMGTNAQRGLSGTPTTPTYDPAAFDQVGKVGLGDLEISDDEQYLFVVNLYSRKLLRMKFDNPANPTTFTEVVEYSLPNITVNNGLLRPWALKYFRGKLYVGAVSTGENGGSITINGASDVRAYVFEVNDPTGNLTFNNTPLLDYPLNYTKGTTTSTTGDNRWYPWTHRASDVIWNGAFNLAYPQPILSDIEFSDRGDMLLTFSDRAGHQLGANNYRFLSTSTEIRYGTSGGDIQVAGLNCQTQTFTLESNGRYNSINGELYSGGVGNVQGPGGGEFFNAEAFGIHAETSMGAMAVLKGTGNVLMTIMDPDAYVTGGVVKFSTSNGAASGAYRLYGDGSVPGATNTALGKAIGLGDLELTGTFAPIEIGNRVWQDTDADGFQDAGELGLANVKVILCDANGVKIDSVLTDANGNYYFSSATGTNTSSAKYGINLLPNTNYILKFPAAVGTNSITTLNAGTNDLIDSDAGTNGQIAFTTGDIGATDHSFDVGYRSCLPAVTNIAQVTATCSGVVVNNNASVTVTATGDKYAIGTSTLYAAATTFTGSFTANNLTAGSLLTFRIFNGADACYRDTTILVNQKLCPAPPCTNTIGGTVFNDFNNNGVFNTTDSLGFAGIKVYAFNCAGVKIDSAVTDYRGRYTLTNVTASNDTVRIEFVRATFPTWAKPTYNGTDGRTDVQFVIAPNCTVDLGLTTDYCQTNPFVMVPCHVNGATTATGDALIRFSYDVTSGGANANKKQLSNTNQIGTTWGIAYQKSTSRLFAAAFLKRHSAMGPNGGGAIYQINPDATGLNGTLFFDMNTVESTGSIADNATRGVNTAAGSPNTDATTFAQIGKVSLGDIDITEDEEFLYTINLATKKLYRVPTTNPTAGNVTSWVIPTPGCVGGEWRPWATKTYRGKVYVGGVCDAATSQLRSDLKAVVYEFTPATGTFSQVLNFKLDFDRGAATWYTALTGSDLDKQSHWNPWTDDFTVAVQTGLHDLYPQPVLSDIEFDVDGSMILGFLDRWGHQTGEANNFPNGVLAEQGVTGGDVMRAYNNNGIYEIENDGKVGPLTVGGTTAQQNYNASSTYAPNGQGRGGKEFYFGDTWMNNHDERSMGSLALLPGSGQVIMAAMDANNTIYSGGTIWLNNTTGLADKAYTLYSGGVASFGKGYALGDLELQCNPQPIQIGNRLWIDTDRDGVQDPCNEPGIANVVVSLYDKAGNFIAKDTTNALGEYYFDATNVVDTVGLAKPNFRGPQPNTQYYIVIGKETIGTGAQFNRADGILTLSTGQKYELTIANSTQNSGNDQNDSDFELAGSSAPVALQGFPVICEATPSSGANHTFDAGFIPACVKPLFTAFTQVNATCSNGVVQNNASVTITSNGDKYAIGTNTAYASATTFTGSFTLNNQIAGSTITVRVFKGENACFKDTTFKVNTVLCPAPPCTNTIGGTVFNDFNNNGVFNTTDSLGFAGIKVYAFNCAGAKIDSAVTDYRGRYTLTNVTAANDTVRIEFVRATFPVWARPTNNGVDGRTDVQFVIAPNCTVDMGLTGLHDYCQASPLMTTTCFVNGASGNGVNPLEVLVKFNYNTSGTTPQPQYLSNKGEFGSVWSTAYNNQTKQLFTGSFLKRHAGLKDMDGDNKGDLGIIWQTSNPYAATLTNSVWADLTKAPYNLDFGTIGDDAARGLGVPTAPSNDATTFPLIGKVGIGDIDISHDNSALWVVNPKGSQLHKIAINTDGSAGALTTFNIPKACGSSYDTLYIKAGGNVNGALINGFVGDEFFSGGVTTSSGRSGAAYSTFRNGAGFEYKISLPNGTYNVQLYFGNNTAARNQTNTVEGTAQTLAIAANASVSQMFNNVAVTDDRLDITINDLPGGDANAILSGIKIWSVAGAKFEDRAYPFALKYHKGKVYVGTTCPAELTQDKEQLKSIVYELTDDGSTIFTPVLTVPLTYTHGRPYSQEPVVRWQAWTGAIDKAFNVDIFTVYPQPVLSDIEFLEDGDMVLGFFDRFGHQSGDRNYKTYGTATIRSTIAGDVLRADANAGNFTLESNGKVGTNTSAGGVGNNQGPGGGEFYSGDNYQTDHLETSYGGMAFIAGRNELAVTVLDPFDVVSSGVTYFNNTNGNSARRYQVTPVSMSTTFFSKAIALGDLEALCDVAPVQIGNRLWIDTDKDGVQDPCNEPGIANVVVSLYDKLGNFLAKDTTNALGEYYFDATNVVDTIGAAKPNVLGPQPNTQYYIVIGKEDSKFNTTTGSLTVGGVGYQLTKLNSTTDGGNDQNDSDFEIATNTAPAVLQGYPVICETTPDAGANHTFDAGFNSTVGSIGDFVWKDLNNNGQQDSGEPGVNGVKMILWSANASGNPVAKLDSTVTATGGKYEFKNLPKGDYIVQLVLSTLPDSCVISSQKDLGPDVTDNDFGTNGLSNVVKLDPVIGGLSKDNPTIDAGLYSPKGSIGDFVWKDQNDNGVQDVGEPAVAGVIVQLLNSTTSAVLATDTTDANGLYLFSNLNSGSYQLKIVTTSLPAGCVISSQQNLGGDDTKDSDFNPTTGLSQTVTIDALGTGIAKDNPTVDAALYSPKGSIGDYVWKDQDNDGVQDAGEPAVAGVIVQLLNPTTSAVLATDTTDANGLYLFSNLNSGSYQLKIVTTSLPAGCVISSQQDLGGNDTKDSDFNPTTGLSQTVTIDALGTGIVKDNPTVDAGLYSPKGSIGDYVWKDQDNDGVQDVGEPAVAGVIVQLLNPTTSAVLATDTTDANGLYLFSNLNSGTYQVKIVTTSLPAGCVISSKQDLGGDDTKDSDFNPTTGLSQTVTIDALGTGIAKDNPTVDAALYSPKGSIGDYVWKDQDNDGVQDAGEPAVAGVIVQLLNPTTSAVLATDTTDANGLYLFSNLNSGSYQVKIVTTSLPAGCVISSQQNLGGDDTKDSDFNPTTGLSQTVTIDALGTGIVKDNPTVDAGLYSPKGSIGDYVWKDQDNDGVQDVGEPAVAGVIVQLLNPTTSAVLATDTTDANGLYLFSNLNSGSYQVKIVTTSLPAGCVISSQQNLGGDDTKDSDFNPTTGLSQTVTIDALGTGIAKDNPTVDAGLYSPKGSIGDYVWKDQDNDGVQDAGEPAVAGVIVQLLNPTTSAVLATDTTDANGLYLFSNLNSGSYQVKIVTTSLPAGCVISSQQNLGGDDTKDSDFNPTTGLSQTVTIDALGTGIAKDNPTVDAGLYSPKGSIGDYVWKDQDNDGVQDAGEPAVAGVIVQLLNPTTSAVLATDTTDANGLYLFSNLNSGSYQLKIVTTSLPAGCVISSQQDLGGDDTKDSDFNPTTGLSQTVTIDALGTGIVKDNPTVDAGLYSPKGSIGDYVWKDQDNDGVQDVGEPAVAGVIVQLLNPSTSAVLATDTTDANGLYLFSNLNSGTYQVKIVTTSLPAGCVISSKQDLGGDDTKDSDFNPTTGLSQTVTIDALGTGIVKDNPTVDAALYSPKGSIGDFVWKDVNNNGLQDLPAEKGVAGVILELYRLEGITTPTPVLVAKDTTDATGKYLFTNLSSGNYFVQLVLSSLADTCQITSKQNEGADDTKDSDFGPTTGRSQVVPIDALGTGIAKDNLTVDAGLIVPCVKSSVIVTEAPLCSQDVQTYSIKFTVNNKMGIVKVNKGTLTGNNPYTVTGIPSGASLIITDSLSALCKADTTIVGPNCNCNPPVPVLLAPSMTACIGDTFPTLKAAIVGLATVEWYSQQTGGTLLSTGLNYKPAGTVTGSTVFYAQARSTDPSCPTAISTSRVPANINAQNCIDTIDLALKKSISTKIARVGDVLTYTVKVWNEWNKNATGVEVTDSIATTAQFVSGSFVASRGSATISGNVIKWTIGNIAANGDTVTLRYQVRATQAGVHLNTAEISKTNEKDRDSTPGNGKGGEDDIDQQCFTVPFELCAGQKLEVGVPANLTNVQWFRNGGTTVVATGNVVLFSEDGVYTFTATNQTCPSNGCCPVIIEPGTNCCPAEVCVPFTVRKVKK